MKRVLVPVGSDAAGANAGWGEIHFVRRSYIEALLRQRLLPILISPLTAIEDAESLLRECGGLLLLGGDDVDAAHYGEVNHSRNSLVIPERDHLELALIRRAVAEKIPLLGICRGAQILNVALGGTLQQHIPDLNLDEEHAPTQYETYNQWITGVRHDIIIEEGTQSARILGTGRFSVPSAHHQSIKRSAPVLRIAGRSPAGIVEMVEHIDSSRFCIGVQSHPEIERDGPFQKLFSAFADFVRKN